MSIANAFEAVLKADQDKAVGIYSLSAEKTRFKVGELGGSVEYTVEATSTDRVKLCITGSPVNLAVVPLPLLMQALKALQPKARGGLQIRIQLPAWSDNVSWKKASTYSDDWVISFEERIHPVALEVRPHGKVELCVGSASVELSTIEFLEAITALKEALTGK